VQQITVAFKNVGQLPLHKVHVASTEPRFYTFGDLSFLDDVSSLVGPYQFDQSPEEDWKQASSSPLDFVSPVPIEALAPGASCSVPMWIRAPSDAAAVHQVDFLFYYESTSPHPKLK
jgi:hypothetical protein